MVSEDNNPSPPPANEVIIDNPNMKVTPGGEARLTCRGSSIETVRFIDWSRVDGVLPPGM